MRLRTVAAFLGMLGLGAVGIRAAGMAEGRIARAVRAEAAAAGISAAAVHVSLMAPVRLQGVAMGGPAGTRMTIDSVAVDWRLRGGADARAHVSGLVLRGVRARRGPLEIEVPAADFEVLAWERYPGGERIRLRQRGGGTVEARSTRRGAESLLEVDLHGFDLSSAVARWEGRPLLMAGRWSGRLAVARERAGLRTGGGLSIHGARFSAGAALGATEAATGPPTDAAVSWLARRDGASLIVDSATVRAQGVVLAAGGRFGRAGAPHALEAELDVEAELASAFRAAGLRLPGPLEARAPSEVGTASLALSVRGDLADPASLRILPRLRFAAAPGSADSLRFLSRPFRHAAPADGARIHVSAVAPDFVPLGDVPPLFVRMLLLAEDAGFFGHPGIDVAEIPVAWAENLERGGFARGASTITQQLARNLFLTREKSYARKLEEAALALALDSAVPKPRILEIYLNVIEWGPGVHGLVPASRHYFGRHPAQLTTREMAFLVCLVPSPVRYHAAHRAGRPGPGMDQLIDNLLAKMHAAGALDGDEYERALAQPLVFTPEDGGAAAPTTG